MEKSLLVDDYLFVSKLHYGTRTPKTILQVPLTHQKIWFTDLPSYLDWIQLPNFRLPGFTSVKNGDVVVFNYPGCPERPDNFGGFDKYPVDLRTNYIKRCVGIAGDVISIKDAQVYINGKPMENPDGLQRFYVMESKRSLNPKIFTKFGVKNLGEKLEGEKFYYRINATEEAVAGLKGYEDVTNIFPDLFGYENIENLDGYNFPTFPHNTNLFKWNRDQFGPLTIPKKGMTIKLDEKNIACYKGVITTFDLNDNAEFKDGKIYIDGKAITEYTFNQDYYFMMGDNRNESDDSRFWGFVPADHIVGKAVFIWMSTDRDGTFINKIRWKRLFSIIK